MSEGLTTRLSPPRIFLPRLVISPRNLNENPEAFLDNYRKALLEIQAFVDRLTIILKAMNVAIDGKQSQVQLTVNDGTTLFSLWPLLNLFAAGGTSFVLAEDINVPETQLTIRSDVNARINSGGSVFARKRINLIAGTNITLAIADDAVNDEIDITVTATAPSNPGVSIRVGTGTVHGPKPTIKFIEGGGCTLSAGLSGEEVTLQISVP